MWPTLLMSLPWRLLGALAGIAAVAGGAWAAGAQHVQAKWDATDIQAALVASETARETERLAAKRITRIANETDVALARARTDAVGARHALDSLRDAATQASANCAVRIAPTSPPASDTTVVLANVLVSAAGRAVELAAALDAATAAGQACERVVDLGRD